MMSTESRPSHRRRFMLTLLASVFILLAIIWLIYWVIFGRFFEYTDDAYVGGNRVQLMSQVAGTVVTIHTDDTQLVLQGQPVVKLDPTDRQIAWQRAQATLAQTVRQVKQYFEKAEQAKAAWISRRADLTKAQYDLKRRTGLVGERAISREEMEHAKIAVAVAQARYYLAEHQMHAAWALVAHSSLYTHPLIKRAKASFKMAYLNLQRTTIVAPVTGYVAKRNVQVGQQINTRTPLLAIIPLNEVWVDANYKESQLSRIRIGQSVSLTADAYSGVTYHARVLGLSPGTGSAFALLPPQNATGNWIKIVQRLPVRIRLDANELREHPLQIGLSMRVTINTSQMTGEILATAAKQQMMYATTVYGKQLGRVNQFIDSILHENAADMSLPALPTGIA